MAHPHFGYDTPELRLRCLTECPPPQGTYPSGDRFVTREEQDAFAAASHQQAAIAWKNGIFESKVVPVPIPQRKGDLVLFTADEGMRAETTVESLARPCQSLSSSRCRRNLPKRMRTKPFSSLIVVRRLLAPPQGCSVAERPVLANVGANAAGVWRLLNEEKIDRVVARGLPG